MDRVLALQRFVRSVAPARPGLPRGFLRPSAAEILHRGPDGAGDTVRLFVCLASSLGIRCQRIMFYHSRPYIRTPLQREHILAEVELEPGQSLIVDPRSNPEVPAPTMLDELIAEPRYERFSTVNLDRLGLEKLISRLKLDVVPLGVWLEKPHWIKSALWLFVSILLLTASGIVEWFEARRYPHRVPDPRMDPVSADELGA